jgi:hypothetical protein
MAALPDINFLRFSFMASPDVLVNKIREEDQCNNLAEN